MRRAREVETVNLSHMEQEGTVMYEDPSENWRTTTTRATRPSLGREEFVATIRCGVRSTRSIFRPRLRVVPLRVRRHPALARVEEVRKGGDAVTFRASTRRSRCRCRNSFIGYKWRRCYCYGDDELPRAATTRLCAEGRSERARSLLGDGHLQLGQTRLSGGALGWEEEAGGGMSVWGDEHGARVRSEVGETCARRVGSRVREVART